MYLIFNYLVQNISIFSFGLVMSFCLTPKYSRIKFLALFQSIYAILFIFKMIWFSNATCLLIMSVFSQAMSYLFALIAFEDSVFKKLLTSTSFIILSCLSEYMTLWLLPEIAPHLDTSTADNKTLFLYSSTGILVQFVFSLFFLFVWRYFTQKKNPLLYLILSLVPMFQITIYVTVLAPFFFGNHVTRPIYIAFSILIALVSNFVLLYFLLRRQEKRTIQDAYEELQVLYSMDLKYYEELEAQHEALAKVRHDYQNQLATLYMLISSNKIDSAQEFINSLQTSLNEIDS